MNKKLIKKTLASAVLGIFFLSLLLIPTSCAKEPVFGNLTVCENVNPETKEPVSAKNEFDFNVQGIYAAIKLENVKSDDNYRFIWKDLDDDSTLRELTGKYTEEENQLLNGWISGSLTIQEGKSALLPSGKYKVEFYHNGELKSSAEFSVKTPQAKILQVVLSKEINEQSEPGNPSEIFEPTDIVHAFVQIDFLVPGDIIQSKWLDEQGNIVFETPLDVTEEYYDPSWVNFYLEGTDGNPIPAGKYSFEVYLNQQLFGQFPFEVVEEHEAGAVTFDKNNYFTEAKDKYNFIISYPDDWSIDWKEDNTGMTVNFYPPLPEEALSLLMIVLDKGNYPTNEQDFENFITTIADGTRGNMQQVGEPVFTEKKMKDNSEYAELIYYFNDSGKGNFGLILSVFLKNERMFIWYGFAHETFYEGLDTAYYTALNSLEFN